MIESISLDTEEEVIARITKTENIRLYSGKADVAIEFTRPEAAASNIIECFKAGIPVVSGTTGWKDDMPRVAEMAEKLNGSLLYSSNFSIGVHLFFRICQKVAGLLSGYPQYTPSIQEIHHTRKLDAPSGTAITLSEKVLPYFPHLTGYSLDEAASNCLHIEAIRQGEVPGIHELRFTSEVDKISIRHEAFSREGFARGALAAARWLIGRTGIYSMDDMLEINF